MALISAADIAGRGVSARPGTRLLGLAGLGLCLLGGAIWAADRPVFGPLLACAAALLTVATFMFARDRARQMQHRRETSLISNLIENDAIPSFLTSADGELIGGNRAAETGFAMAGAVTLAGLLDATFANATGILYRLQSRAAAAGNAQEDIFTRKGHLRLSVHQAEENRFLWRLQELGDRAVAPSTQEGMTLPMLMVGRGNSVLFMNDAARDLIGQRATSLDRVFPALPVRPGLPNEVSVEAGSRTMLVSEVDAGAGRRALYLLPTPEHAGNAGSQGWQAFQELPVPLVKVAPDGTVQSFNRTAAQLIGDALKEGEHLSSLMEGLGRSINDWIADTLANRLIRKSEFLRLTRTDREVFVQVVLNRITEAGETALIAVMHDATELKSLEAQFVQSQKMQAIGQLAGGVAHDFNNLLTAISGHCDLLLLRHDQGDPEYGDLVQINQNANRAAALVGQLLAFSRKQTLLPETIDLRDTLSDLTHPLNRLVGERITLTLSHDPALKPIRADKRQLEQVLMNLVVNARDAMPMGGEIRIVTELQALETPLTRDRVTVPVGNYVTIRVVDTGSGIAKDKLQKVFEPFFTTKRTGEGTGLGLSTAYGIVKQTGGFIFVDSEIASGTTFILYFPVFERGAQDEAQASIPLKTAPTRAEDGVILLVEDEAPVRAFASRALRLSGYTVLEADSAEAALLTLEDETLEIDVFVTDVVMPGMDGPCWVREALKTRPDVRVVFVSGYAEDSFGEEQTKIPNSVFLPKPFSLTDLTETVQRQLH